VFTLKLLGGACVEGPEGPLTGRVAQRRRLAVLALLAMSRRQGLGREKLAATLWPESDGDRARHLLSDTVYVINRALGASDADVVTAAAGELRLRAGAITCDARAFEDAVESGELDEAVRLYTGPFLDGFFVDGSEEFERWTCSERERLHDLYGRTLERLATARADRGDLGGALEGWRRLAAGDPLNSRVACRVAETLDRIGDRAGALHHLRTHIATLKEELGIAPPADVTTLLRALRIAPAAAPEVPEAPEARKAPEAPEAHETPKTPAADAPPRELDAAAVAAGTDASPRAVDALHGEGGPEEERRSPRGDRRASAPGAEAPHRRPIVLAALTAVGALVMVALALVASRVWQNPAAAGTTPTAVRSVAVMPFADLSPARDHEYFGDGTAEELSTRLARVPGLKVAARTSAFSFKGGHADAKAIGRALNVDALLEGSVRQEKGRVRIAVRLVDAREGYQIWADTWECDGDKVLAMQDDIATDVLSVLRAATTPAAPAAATSTSTGGRPTLTPGADSAVTRRTIGATETDTSAPTASPATATAATLTAYNLYLQGRYFWHQRTRDSLTRAAAAFDRAAALAPNYAEAHSGVADAYAVLGFYDHLPPREAFPRAKAAARRALEIDDRLAAAYASLGYVALYYDWDWAAAERDFDRAVELNPSYSIGHQWRGNYLVARGRFDEAEAAMRRAQEVDPLSLIASAALCWVQFHGRKFDAAAQQCQRTIELNPNFVQAWQWGGSAHEGAGRYAEAIRMLKRAAELSNQSAIAMTALGRAYALSGDTASARRIADSLRRERAGYLPAYEMAKLHLALGDRAEALDWLRRAYDQRSHSIVFLAVDPQLDPLRSDREFRDLLVKTGVGKF
jgi:TolB-like protein/DNA-binding SARP family transcriptional activator/tetratricopeptide (TPR) repeat protein